MKSSRHATSSSDIAKLLKSGGADARAETHGRKPALMRSTRGLSRMAVILFISNLVSGAPIGLIWNEDRMV
jgi:hypothetical protein